MKNENQEKNLKGESVKVTIILIFFCLLLAGGLLAVDVNFNSIIDSPQKVRIIVVEKFTDSIYSVNLMGVKNEINVAKYERILEKTGELISAGFNRAKDCMSGFLDQAKRCSTF